MNNPTAWEVWAVEVKTYRVVKEKIVDSQVIFPLVKEFERTGNIFMPNLELAELYETFPQGKILR